MTALNAPTFTAHGVFAGFFRDIFGKRRMVLREGGHEVFLKVPKALRRALHDGLSPGQDVVVCGHDDEKKNQRVVTSVRLAGAATAIASPIFVCAKKNCWRSGGQSVWDALERGIAASGLAESIKIRAVGCLGHCKQAPNLEWNGESIHRCSLRDVDRLLREVNGTSAD